MKVILVNRYFHPDESATSQLLSDLAFHLAGGANEVHVITSRQRYDEASSALPIRETIDGVNIVRIWTTRFGRAGLIGRALDYVTFYASASAELVLLARKGDIVIAKTDPPLLSVFAAIVTKAQGGILINWLQDLFPEVAAAAGLQWTKGGVAKALRNWRDWSLRSAALNVVVGERMRDVLLARGIEPHKLTVIPNWADGEAIRPVAVADNPLRKKWGLEGKFVVGYSGNLGRVHDFDTTVGAMAELREDEGIWFLFIGAGKQRPMLEAQCKALGITAVSFLPYQAREDLIWSLGVPDVHLVSLLPEMEGLVVPSKFYGIAAAGRPTLFIGDPEGEIGKLVHRFDCGITIRQGEAAALAEAILLLQRDKLLRDRLGANARKVFEERYDRKIALSAWSAIIESCRMPARAPGRPP